MYIDKYIMYMYCTIYRYNVYLSKKQFIKICIAIQILHIIFIPIIVMQNILSTTLSHESRVLVYTFKSQIVQSVFQ